MNDELFYYIDAHNDDDLSDGAWWCVLEDSVEAWNRDHGTNLDLNDTVQQYISRTPEVIEGTKSALDNLSIK